ncbi:hypothetical protein L1987_48865 [Smallanthus sonchifolius]|uniref:Uncharacterized protein n=1 Tax=Smallanthus sonchifolius TaxID=185202 RepID=A0ACB9FT63_9ASTR|nr:hypothetical protein L1987_48865 [Smallanthus sonchifolius]
MGTFPSRQIVKTFLNANWEYLLYVIIICSSRKETAFDQVSTRVQHLMHGLARNINFYFSRYLIKDVVANASYPLAEKFLMYLRELELRMSRISLQISTQSISNNEEWQKSQDQMEKSKGKRRMPPTLEDCWLFMTS